MALIQNDPSLWRDKFPVYDPKGHKYDRGVVLIFGAPKMTGATRLAARAAARMGAGLVKVIAPVGTGEIYRSTLHEEIIVEDAGEFQGFSDSRIKSVLFGPGCRCDDIDARIVQEALMAEHLKLVLDAGAIAAFEGRGDVRRVVMTPHDGEFSAKFGKPKPRIEAAQKASAASGATILLKGPQTIVVGEGDVVLQERDVPELATAGTGDVLAGMVAGLLAQGMEMKWACSAAVWIHAEVAARFGRGMVAGDLPEMIPDILQNL